MSYSYELGSHAGKEFSDSYVWYEEQQDGLGEQFIEAVYDKIDQICKNPYHYKTWYKNYREALTDKFPFLIAYKIDEINQKITVIAIFHTSRNPKKKFRKR